MPEHEVSIKSSAQDSAVPVPWWVKVSRVLWRVLLWFWGTLLVGIVIGTFSNLNTTTIGKTGETGTSLTDILSKLFIVQLFRSFPFPAFFVFGFLVLLTLLTWVGNHVYNASRLRPLSALPTDAYRIIAGSRPGRIGPGGETDGSPECNKILFTSP